MALFVLFITCMPASDDSIAQIVSIRSRLADVYQRISAIHLEYEDTPTEGQLVLGVSRSYRLTDSPPFKVSMRQERIQQLDGSVECSTSTEYIDGMNRTVVHDEMRSARTGAFQTSPIVIHNAPLLAIGYRFGTSLGMGIDQLLSEPEHVRVVGHEQIDGISTIVLQIHPVPRVLYPKTSAEGLERTKVTLWLIPEYDFLPKRLHVCVVGEPRLPGRYKDIVKSYIPSSKSCSDGYHLRQGFDNHDFRAVKDGLRGRVLHLPFRIMDRTAVGVRRLDVKRFDINPKLAASVFVPKIPDSYTIYDDNGIRRRGSHVPTSSPPVAAIKPAIVSEQSVAAARQAASQATAPTPTDSKLGWLLTFGLIGVLGVLLLLWRNRR